MAIACAFLRCIDDVGLQQGLDSTCKVLHNRGQCSSGVPSSTVSLEVGNACGLRQSKFWNKS